MNRFVYRRAYISAFVYRQLLFAIHKRKGLSFYKTEEIT